MNKIVLNTIGVNTVRLNTVGEWRKSGGGGGGSISYPGLIAAWSAKGKSNDDEDRATLRDLTGNGHDITLNGFAFAEMSGYGGYNTWFKYDTNWVVSNNNSLNVQSFGYKVILKPSDAGIFNTNNLRYINYNSLTLKFKTNIDCSFIIQLRINGETKIENISIKANTKTVIELEDVNNVDGIEQRWCYWNKYKNNLPEEGLIIELIPEYPDALVFDGVDDYGINEDMPVLTDYTIIAKRKWITWVDSSAFISKRVSNNYGAFIFEKNKVNAKCFTSSFNEWNANNVEFEDLDISWQNKNSYNCQDIKSGDLIDTNTFLLGTGIRGSERLNCAFYSAYLFDRSLDEQEIKAFIRKYIDPEYLLPSEIPTPDCYYDFSKGSNDDETRDTIKDLSGNGNDAVAHNFA